MDSSDGQQPQKTSDNFRVIIKTNLDLSEEQINTIINVVKHGILSNNSYKDIANNIKISLDFTDKNVILNRIINGMKVKITSLWEVIFMFYYLLTFNTYTL